MNKKLKVDNKSIFVHEESIIEELKADDALLDLFIKDAIVDFKKTQDIKIFIFNLKCIIAAKSGMTKIAKQANITNQGLYQMIHNQDFKLSNFLAILHALGLNLDIKPVPNKYKYL